MEFRRGINDRTAENYGFASMAAVPFAHLVAHKLQDKRIMGARIELAPNPKDIVGHFVSFTSLIADMSADLGQHDNG
jgi:hypothetical protein